MLTSIGVRQIAVIHSIVALAFSVCIFSQPQALGQTSRRLDSAALEHAYRASVRVYGIDSLTQKQNSAQFSAVVVSADGYMLAVAHATRSGALYKVRFPDGGETIARALGRIITDTDTSPPDVAILKIEEEGQWSYAETGWSSSLQKGMFCFGISYPESLRLFAPFVRYGHIVEPLDQGGFVKSTCLMETGDSGGPLFDALGRVVALRSRIYLPEREGHEVPIDLYRKYWSALKETKTYKGEPSVTDSIAKDLRIEELLAASEKVSFPRVSFVDAAENFRFVATIYSHDGQKRVSGTTFSVTGIGSIIVSKSSEVGEDPFLDINGTRKTLRIVHRDRKNDLVALVQTDNTDRQKPSGIPFDSIKDKGSGVGTVLYTPLSEKKNKVGVLGMDNVELPLRFSAGSLGASLRAYDGTPTFIRLDKDGASESAGILTGDEVLSLNGTAMRSAQDFNSEISQYYPGDEMLFKIRRGTDVFSIPVLLKAREFREISHPMNKFRGGKSFRRDGFERAFIHDSAIHSYECGSPVFDIEGDFLGINIARFSHTASIALRAETVMEFLSQVRRLVVEK